ncbi:phosphoenolpyruvate hydrolase family protein [Brevibacillus fulvus]|uniref:Transcriptional regulator with PAS, ATPase and Fis domain n=1 Tax=Brevibacillus fulvus TaxID=1125967 RepID=A0A938XSA8_9BACL|nr:phosphoenolpyruvate hydrolase family protein [Brevibacillus fulvus]MBM7589027.1 transcriptional regulator with PAS, ATPase and Fis domain [Brevibacillus fulvus]
MLQPKEWVRQAFGQMLKQNRPVIGVATGTGFAARQAVEGGADFLLALNAGRFRSSGISAMGCLLPFANSNQMVLDFASRELLPNAKGKPVIFGVCATDPTVDREKLLQQIKREGFHGVNNFPTVGLIDGKFREALEEQGLGFQLEIDFLAEAARAGLFTIGFVFDELQAEAMAAANVDVICTHLGWTIGGETGVKTGLSLEEAAVLVQRNEQAARRMNRHSYHMVYGGPIVSPEQAGYLYKQTRIIGTIGGSCFERLPTEAKIKEITDQFKNFTGLADNAGFRGEHLQKQSGFGELIGQSRAMQELYELIRRVANKNVNVLVTGESGTGKELIVRALHDCSDRRGEAFIKVNCAALPDNLLESELFGHEKGAFTGATQQRLGRFELAHKGTLFLDEIGEMSLATQAKLLRAIQQQEFERLGSNKTIKVDVRIVCATNVDLRKAVTEGRFREDLFYRLNVVTIQTVPLREHKEDLPLLIHHFLHKINDKFQCSIRKLTPAAMDALTMYDYPGNVRELEHMLERASILCNGEIIGLPHLPGYVQQTLERQHHLTVPDDQPRFADHLTTVASFEREMILQVLQKALWNRSKAAKQLNITRRTLYNKMKKYKIEPQTEQRE